LDESHAAKNRTLPTNQTCMQVSTGLAEPAPS